MILINLPLHNGACNLARFLESVKAQTCSRFQVVMSDNASSDDTEAICRKYVEADARFRYHRYPARVLYSTCYKRGYFAAMGCEFMILGSANAVWAPEYLTEAVRTLEARPEALAAYSDPIFLDENGERLETPAGWNDCDLSDPDPARRFLNFLEKADYYPARYGLYRVEKMLTHAASLAGQSDGRSAVRMLALAGPLVEMENPLWSLTVPSLETLSLESDAPYAARGNQLREVSMVAPAINYFATALACVIGAPLEPLERDALIPRTVKVLVARYGSRCADELRTLVEKVLAGDLYYACAQPRPQKGRYNNYDHYAYVNLAHTLEYMRNFFPEVPGLYCALASCQAALLRPKEALLALDEELARNPDHPGALALKARIESEASGTAPEEKRVPRPT